MARLAAVSELRQDWLEELSELVRIPSVSADPERQDDVRAAADWVVAKLRAAGGDAELVDWPAPTGSGRSRSASSAPRKMPTSAPTVLCYGHFDVQPPAPLELWETPPFEPTVRGEWLYARGMADDKGQLWMLLKAAELLAEAGELPVNLRFACDGEEEIGGHSIVDWLAADERGADAGIVFDSGMQRRGAPEFNLAVRGLCYFHVAVRTGERDLHSGMYGGVSLNALHALLQTLSGVLARDGRLPEPLRAGIAPPTDGGARRLARASARGRGDRGAGLAPDGCRSGRGLLRAHLGRAGGRRARDRRRLAELVKTVLPVEAEANVSIRLAPGQDPVAIAEAFERLLREAAPAGAEVEVVQRSSAPPGLISPESPVVALAQDAFEHVTGVRPLLVRSGGSIPLVPALAARGIPAIVTGFALPDSNVHSPNERMLVDYMRLGVATARELFLRLGRSWLSGYSSPLAAELADDVLERFLRYVRIDTQSAYGQSTSPSTAKQLDLSRLLEAELLELGLDDVRARRVRLRLRVAARGRRARPVIGLIAHVDTSPDVTGTNVQPTVHRGYDGSRLVLSGDDTQVLDPQEQPALAEKSGTTSSRPTARRCWAPTTRPAWPRSWRGRLPQAQRRLGARADSGLLHRRRGDRRAAPTTSTWTTSAPSYAYTLDGSGLGRDRDRDVQRLEGGRDDPRARRPSRARRRGSS